MFYNLVTRNRTYVYGRKKKKSQIKALKYNYTISCVDHYHRGNNMNMKMFQGYTIISHQD